MNPGSHEVDSTQARFARDRLISLLGAEPWFRGAGITACDGRLPDGRFSWSMASGPGARNGAAYVYAAQLNVRDDGDVDRARAMIGDSILGVPIVYQVVGDIRALVAGSDAVGTMTWWSSMAIPQTPYPVPFGFRRPWMRPWGWLPRRRFYRGWPRLWGRRRFGW